MNGANSIMGDNKKLANNDDPLSTVQCSYFIFIHPHLNAIFLYSNGELWIRPKNGVMIE